MWEDWVHQGQCHPWPGCGGGVRKKANNKRGGNAWGGAGNKKDNDRNISHGKTLNKIVFTGIK